VIAGTGPAKRAKCRRPRMGVSFLECRENTRFRHFLHRGWLRGKRVVSSVRVEGARTGETIIGVKLSQVKGWQDRDGKPWWNVPRVGTSIQAHKHCSRWLDRQTGQELAAEWPDDSGSLWR